MRNRKNAPTFQSLNPSCSVKTCSTSAPYSIVSSATSSTKSLTSSSPPLHKGARPGRHGEIMVAGAYPVPLSIVELEHQRVDLGHHQREDDVVEPQYSKATLAVRLG